MLNIKYEVIEQNMKMKQVIKRTHAADEIKWYLTKHNKVIHKAEA